MSVEIERKFLVSDTSAQALWRGAPGVAYRQGYLNRDKIRTVRVRIAGDAGFLTVKGVSVGATRAEFEYAIPLADAQALLALCDGPLIEKTRHVLDTKARAGKWMSLRVTTRAWWWLKWNCRVKRRLSTYPAGWATK